MKTYKTLFLAFAAFAFILSAFMPNAEVSAAVRFDESAVRFGSNSVRFDESAVRFESSAVRFNENAVRFEAGAVRMADDAAVRMADAKLATVTRVSLVKVEDRTATIRVSGTHLCEKVNFATKVAGNVIALEAQEAGDKKCGSAPKSFVREVKVKALMPGETYSVTVNGLQRLTGVKISSSAPGGSDAVVQKPNEISNKLANLRKITLVSTAPYKATFHLTGTYTCDKVRFSSDVIGKTIYVNVHDVKNRGNDCDKGGGTYSNWLTFERLVPGVYTVHVNSDEDGVPDRKLKDVIIPIPTAQ